MKINEHKRSRDLPARNLSPEQAAALRKRTMQWREEWRAEVSARRGEANGHGRAARGPKVTPAGKKRATGGQFAAAVARQEFGRFYWNGKLAGQLASAMKERPAKRRSQSDRAIN